MDPKQLEKKVYRYFESGYHCAEVITRTVLEEFMPPPHEPLVRAASGFGGGIAGTMTALCGAFTGGVLALGALSGRANPGDELIRCGTLVTAFKSYFQDQFGSLDCPTLVQGFGTERAARGCARLTVDTAVMLSEMLQEFESQKDVYNELAAAGHKAGLRCPFTAGRQAVSV